MRISNTNAGTTTSPYVYYAFGNLISFGVQTYTSYIFNEAVLGWGQNDVYGRYRAKSSLIRQATSTMFAADGLQGMPMKSRPDASGVGQTQGMGTVYNLQPYAPVTLNDAFLGPANPKGNIAGDPQCFDLKRHQGKINIAFCDGHVECRNITSGDLTTVFLMAP